MKLIFSFILIVVLTTTFFIAAETKIVFSSKEKQTTLIELFTSQGCSSCPPADKWLNKFVNDEKVWIDFVPVAFHVDYWNYLGWVDPYSFKEATLRQYRYRTEGSIKSVYTPAIIINGKEYRGNRPKPNDSSGILRAYIEGNNVSVDYSKQLENLELKVAILGFGIKTDIKAGENHNKKLRQEFVVLHYKTYFSDKSKWLFQLPELDFSSVKKYGIAIWVNQKGKQTPIQATGSWL